MRRRSGNVQTPNHWLDQPAASFGWTVEAAAGQPLRSAAKRMKRFSLVVGIMIALIPEAQSCLQGTLESKVESSAYIVVGKVFRLEFIDKEGHEIPEPKAAPNPDNKYGVHHACAEKPYTLRLHITTERKNTVKGNPKDIPNEMIIATKYGWDPAMAKKDYVGNRFLMLLSKRLAPTEDEPMYPMEDLREIKRLVKKGPAKQPPVTRQFLSGAH